MINLKIEDDNYNVHNFVFPDMESCSKFIERHMKFCEQKCRYTITKKEEEEVAEMLENQGEN